MIADEHPQTPTPAGVREGVVEGDNLEVLQALPDGCIDLIYIDPPFGTGQTRRLDSIRTGAGARTRVGFGGRTYRWETVSVHEYQDGMELDEYLAFLAERLTEMHRVLAPRGSLYVHLDHHAVHHVRMLLDGIFGPQVEGHPDRVRVAGAVIKAGHQGDNRSPGGDEPEGQLG